MKIGLDLVVVKVSGLARLVRGVTGLKNSSTRG